MIVLHHVPQARSFRALWLLEEIGADYRLVEYSFFDKSLRSAEFLKISPAGRVPVLEADGQTLFESGAIGQYLAETRAPHLDRPSGHAERGAFLEWLHFAETIGAHLSNLTQHHIALRDPHMRSPTVMRLEAARLKNCLRSVAAVAGEGFVLPSGFSLVDIHLGYGVLTGARFVDYAGLPQVAAYLERLRARPGFQRALAHDGEPQIYRADFYPAPEPEPEAAPEPEPEVKGARMAEAETRGPSTQGPAIRGPSTRGPAIRGPSTRGPEKPTVEIFEVGPRDGLQNESRPIALSDKIALVDCLSRAGFRRIEVASFVSPRWVPQMADSGAVLAGIIRAPGVRYAALTPNLRGYSDAVAARADEVAVFASASEGFSRANLNCAVADSLLRFAPVLEAARADGVPVRGYVSCVSDCPFDGPTDPGAVVRVVSALRDMGCYEVSLGDTLGRATPERIDAMLRAVLAGVAPGFVAGHFHDTAGRALDNIAVALEHGVRVFDAAVGGLGGCPYAPGAAGNVATGAVQARLTALGYATGLDAGVIAQAGALARAMRGGESDSEIDSDSESDSDGIRGERA